MKPVNIKSSNKFGKWLKQFCNKHNIDAKTLAKTFGIDRRHITHWIQGTSHPRTINTFFLFDALSKLSGIEPKEIYAEAAKQITKDY